MTYAGLSSLIGSRAVHVDEEQGLVTFAYAAPSAIAAGQALAEVKFTYAAPHVASTLRLTTLQKNEDVTVSARRWSFPSAMGLPLRHLPGSRPQRLVSRKHRLCPERRTHERHVRHRVLPQWKADPRPDGDNPVPHGRKSCSGQRRSLYRDVKAGRYYTQAIRWAWAEGIANGITPTRFAPEEPITREQMVTFLARYAASTGKKIASQVDLSSFPDSELISEYAKESMAWAVENGILNGMDGKLAP